VGNSPTSESIEEYRKYFGDDHFSFWTNQVLNVVINSNLITSNGEKCKKISTEQNEWLTNLLKENQNLAKHILVFQHIPAFLANGDEEDEYFNFPSKYRRPYLDLLKQNGVKYVFAGYTNFCFFQFFYLNNYFFIFFSHYHRNAIGFDGNLEMITTSAVSRQLGSDKSGFRIVKVYEDKVVHQYYSFEEMPEKIDL
jgi:serine/threonine-protein phosphatase CPPED1